MPLATTITALLLTVGCVLALFGTAGCTLNRRQDSDPDSQAVTRAIAGAGRTLLLTAITATALRHTLPAPAVFAAAGIAALTLTTRAPAAGRHRAAPAHPKDSPRARPGAARGEPATGANR